MTFASVLVTRDKDLEQLMDKGLGKFLIYFGNTIESNLSE